MSDLGQQLKEARTARGLTLDDVQEMTKIRKRYLEAIEAGDYKVLPGSFYVRAFIKTYAEAVGVSADELLTEHQNDVPVPEAEPVMEPVLQRRRNKATDQNPKWMSTVLMWSFLVIIVVVVYLVVMNNNKGGSNSTADPTPVTSADASSLPGGGASPSTEPSAAEPSASTAPVQSTEGSEAPASETPAATDDVQNSTPPVTDGVTVTENGKVGSAVLFNVQSPDNAPVQVQITASGRSWTEVREGDKNGKKLFYDNTKEGDVLTFDLTSAGMFLKSGNSNYTVITVGGQPVDDGRNTTKIQLQLGAPASSDDGSLESTTP